MRTISKIKVLIIISVMFLLVIGSSGCTKKVETLSELEQFMFDYNEYCSYKYNGSILVAKGDEILLNQAYGTANFEEGIPNSTDSVFAIGSITKSITAMAILQLNEKGLLSLDDPISKYIDGNKNGDIITVHHLLTHTSGLSREGKFSQSKYVSLEDNVDFINKCSIKAAPGETYLYSNAGYIILAAIVEKVSGQAFCDYISENIFTPLNMDSSSCGKDDLYGKNQAIGYEILSSSRLKLSIYDFSCITGSGNVYSTTQDLYKYYLGISRSELVMQETLDCILNPHWGDNNFGYGYGWDISQRYGHKKISHGGCIGGGGYNSLMVMYPNEDYVLIFLTNNADRTALDAVSQSLEAILFDESYVVPEKLITAGAAPELLETYAGDYQLEENIIITVSYNNGKLFSTADDGRNYELIPISDTEFYYDNHQLTRCKFMLNDESNKVNLVIQSRTYTLNGIKIDE